MHLVVPQHTIPIHLAFQDPLLKWSHFFHLSKNANLNANTPSSRTSWSSWSADRHRAASYEVPGHFQGVWWGGPCVVQTETGFHTWPCRTDRHQLYTSPILTVISSWLSLLFITVCSSNMHLWSLDYQSKHISKPLTIARSQYLINGWGEQRWS